MRPVTKPLALLGACCVALAATAIGAQDGIVRSDDFPPVAVKRTGPVSLEEATAVLKTLRQLPEILTTHLHEALGTVSRDPRAARALQRDVSMALTAVEEMRRELLEPLRSTKGFPGSELAILERELGDVQDLARSVRDDLESHEERFIRGDSNGDGAVDMSDAVRTLSYLYLGAPPSTCLAAADANDDEALDVSDAIRTLTTLFLSPVPLPPPSSEPGVDPTPGLGCVVGLEADEAPAGGGAALRTMGPISIDRGLRINCYWVCLFVCTPNFCVYYCTTVCILA